MLYGFGIIKVEGWLMETPEERLKKEKGRREYCKYKITVEESNKLVIDGFRCNALDIYTLFVWYNVKDIYGNASITKTYVNGKHFSINFGN